MKIKVFRKGGADFDGPAFEAVERRVHLLEINLKFFALGGQSARVVIQVKVPLLLFPLKKRHLHCRAVDAVIWDIAPAIAFEGASLGADQLGDKRLAALAHDDEMILFLVHILDVGPAEVAAIEHEADRSITVLTHLVNEVLELADIIDGPRVLFVKERHLVGFVVGQRKIEDRQTFVVLGVAELDDVDVAGLAVLVGRVVGKVDALSMILTPVPIVEKPLNLILGNVGKKARKT